MNEGTRKTNIARFEKMIQTVKRPGIENLLEYIRRSDFYTAPASTRFHSSYEGGLLQHSLNVYDAIIGRMEMNADSPDKITFQVSTAGHQVAEFSRDSIILTSLLHDICKTHFYKVDYRNQKVYKPGGSKRDAGGAYDWERVPFYAIDDRNPYGHGEKSVMMISEFIRLTMEERYAIRWHMGMADCGPTETRNFNQSIEKYPLVLFLHNADQEASHFMESSDGNKEGYRQIQAGEPPAAGGEEWPPYDEAEMLRESPFEEAPKI